MCGIAGFLGPRRNDLPTITAALGKLLAHRGPDGEGVETFPTRADPARVVALVQRRLAIIDLSPRGAQPMPDPETGNWVMQNGEIYNYRELRAELAARGAVFRSESDTEVILKGYAVWGPAVLDRLEGMFAVAIWDAARDELLLGVDPAGIKPLYYWQGAEGRALFASEVRALLGTGLVSRDLDPVGLEGYLAYGAVPAPATIVRGVRALPGGSRLRLRSDGTALGPTRYATLEFAPAGAPPLDAGALVSGLRAALEDAVRRHLASDVPVGVFLSGGIDSSSVAALMHTVAPGSVWSFSVTFDEARFSEAPYSALVARRYSARHEEIRLSARGLLGMLPDALAAIDQPTMDGINVYALSRAVRERGLKVVLSGQGGDELFGGYPTFTLVPRALAWRRRLGLLPAGARSLAAGAWSRLRRRSAVPDKGARLLAGDGDPLGTYLVFRELFPPASRAALFPGRPGDETAHGLPLALAAELARETRGLDPVNQVSLLELRIYLANMLLRDGDVMSMAHGLEVRVPLLDRRLVEVVARVPGRQKLDARLPKPLLVRALADRLPPEIYGRPKQGFTLPWEEWLRGDLRAVVADRFESASIAGAVGLDDRACRAFWRGFVARRPGRSWARVWALFVLLDWCRRHIAGR